MKTSPEETIKQYVASWNVKGAEAIKAAFAKCWAADATYTDPNYENVSGVDGISALCVGSHEIAPGRIFHVHTLPDHHHNVALYTWTVDIPGKETKGGTDYIEFDAEGKIARLVSFFPPLQ
ncbi:nuclear transport factor 2 family protein [Mucilaginibacter dorajii]|uniref:SnoaL-like domain-containing protein n=1 Tax=Mucilaginibacter dorajii TaxID=692994 RepID=A0ABP7QV43_9SPHI|nr:nuclear transport factor 2 family protein [Mucilaginibacter dorajii]MCS3735740.1 hypothetical protein [Mucilaginibacter dorajii]